MRKTHFSWGDDCAHAICSATCQLFTNQPSSFLGSLVPKKRIFEQQWGILFMLFIRDQYNKIISGVATIGSFDGVHLGHQQLLRATVARAHELGLPATVITFEPQPKEYFVSNQIRLTTWSEKLLLFKALGIEQVICLRFNEFLTRLSANDFIEKILIERLNIRYLMVGDDFRFGYQQSGNVQELARHLSRNFMAEVVPDFLIDGILVKSTMIREALVADDLAKVMRFLGRPYSIIGRVAHGDQRGRLLGFPTANLYLSAKIAPLRGVYATVVRLGEEVFLGCANIGFRPTIGDGKHVLEVNLLNFDRDIYGCRIKVEFMQKIRDERKFANFTELRQQIAADVAKVTTEI